MELLVPEFMSLINQTDKDMKEHALVKYPNRVEYFTSNLRSKVHFTYHSNAEYIFHTHFVARKRVGEFFSYTDLNNLYEIPIDQILGYKDLKGDYTIIIAEHSKMTLEILKQANEVNKEMNRALSSQDWKTYYASVRQMANFSLLVGYKKVLNSLDIYF